MNNSSEVEDQVLKDNGAACVSFISQLLFNQVVGDGSKWV